MRITESRIRQIIREEARRVLSEQPNAQAAGAAIDRAVQQAPAALANAATKVATGNMSPQEITQISTTIADFILKYNPAFRLTASIPGVRDVVIKAVSSGLGSVPAMTYKMRIAISNPEKLIAVLNEMHNQKQFEGIITRLQSQNKGYAEIAGAIADAIATRFNAMN